MKDDERKKIEDQIASLNILYEDCLLSSKQLETFYNKTDYREFLIMILLKRTLKFLNAYIILIRNELGEPSMSLVRSIFEASLYIRWCLKDEENVIKYFKEGLSNMRKVLKNLLEKKYFAGENQIILEEAYDKILKENINYTQWVKIAKVTDMYEIFKFVYPVLSAMSHGSLMSISSHIEKKDIFEDSDFINISASIPLAYNFSTDCHVLCSEWIYNKRIRDIPDLKNLLSKLN